MLFLMHVYHPSGKVQTWTFDSAFSRGLAVIAFAAQPVIVKIEDLEPAS